MYNYNIYGEQDEFEENKSRCLNFISVENTENQFAILMEA